MGVGLVRTAAELVRAQGERLAELKAKADQVWQKGERTRAEVRALFDAHSGQVMSQEQLNQAETMVQACYAALDQWQRVREEICRIELFNLPVPDGPMQ